MEDTPPPLQQRVELTSEQAAAAKRLLTSLSVSLESMPVVLAQDGSPAVFAGAIPPSIAAHIAQTADRHWREGATRPAREFMQFQEEVFEEDDLRLSLLLYSVHIHGALTLSAGWQLSISLTQLRAEMLDARESLRTLLIP
ncbi:MAG: hypothetical protein GYB64_10155 [Chloroflexi bacterium]|nr:hypothetical protein [Chloroflexota bacterium]